MEEILGEKTLKHVIPLVNTLYVNCLGFLNKMSMRKEWQLLLIDVDW